MPQVRSSRLLANTRPLNTLSQFADSTLDPARYALEAITTLTRASCLVDGVSYASSCGANDASYSRSDSTDGFAKLWKG